MPEMDLQLQWHSPDQAWFAVLVRDGEPWYLEGALVGQGTHQGEAVMDLIGQVRHLIIHGGNFLTSAIYVDGKIPLEDRIWLFKLLDVGGLGDEVYQAIRAANNGVDPYKGIVP